jgi:hypothetical protein
MVAEKVAALNKALVRDEMHELNTLVAWMYGAYNTLSVGQYEAILSLRADGRSVGLEDRIKKRYYELLSLDDKKDVRFRDGVQEFLEQMNKQSTDQTDAPQRSAAAIEAPEVALVQKVLQTHFRNVFGDGDVYARFAFDDFFEKKLGDQAVRLRLVPEESRAQVALGCLVTVCDRYEDERSGALLRYAYDWFVEHLGDVKLDETNTLTKQDIGRKLTRMLRETPLIEAWWTQERWYLTRDFLFTEYSRNLANTVHRWLKDPDVQKGLMDMPSERQWVMRVTSGDQPNFELYVNVAKVMAKRWFESPEDPNPFYWLYGYLQSVRITIVIVITKSLTNYEAAWQSARVDRTGR